MTPTSSHVSRSSDGKEAVAGELIFEVDSRANSQADNEAHDNSQTLWQNVKKYRKVVYVTFGLTSAILLYGYDNVVVGTVSAMPVFQ